MAALPAPAGRVAISRDSLLRALRPSAAPATGPASTADLTTAVLRGTASPSERALLSSQLFAYQHTPSVDLVAQIGAWLVSDAFAAKDAPLVARAAAFETALEALVSLMQPVDRLPLREAARRVFLMQCAIICAQPLFCSCLALSSRPLPSTFHGAPLRCRFCDREKCESAVP